MRNGNAHTIWFTADTHFTHTNIIRYCNRPFSSIQEHDEVLIQNWNKVVKGKDTVYHLGDFGFNNTDKFCNIINKLHGNIYLIRGNHDKQEVIEHKRFKIVKDVHRFKRDKQEFFLSHYAHRTWPKMNYGAIHLFGHSHGNMPDFGRSTDVGVDRWNYTPVSIDQILDKMLQIVPVLDYQNGELDE